MSSPKAQGERTASPSRSFRNRMGTIMRRTSSGLAFSRPNSVRRSESKSSLKVDAALAPSTEDTHQAPSPVIESPAREAAAESSPTVPAPLGPSPLSGESSKPPADTTAQSSPAPSQAPVLERAMTAESGRMVSERPSTSGPQPAERAPQPIASAPAVEIAPRPAAEARAETVRVEQIAVEEGPSGAPMREASVIVPSLPSSRPVTPTAPPAPAVENAVERRADAFAWTDEQALAPKWSRSPSASRKDSKSSSQLRQASGPAEATGTTGAETFAWKTEITVSPKQSTSSFTGKESVRQPAESSQPSRGRISTRGSRSSLASSYGHVVVSTGGKHVSVSMDSETGDGRRGRSPGPSVRIAVDDPYTDPFADPPQSMPVPRPGLSPIDSIDTPAPEMPQPSLIHEQPPVESAYHELTPAPITFPLPPSRDVIGPSKTLRDAPSGYSLGDGSTVAEQVRHDTDERLPLLPRAVSPGFGGNGKLCASQDAPSSAAISFPTAEVLSGPAAAHSIETLGWTEHVLPDSSFYYAHAGMRVSTDIDLRNAKKLDRVTEYLEKKLPEEIALPPQGWELWLRDAGTTRHDFKPLRNWVNHKARTLSFDPPPTLSGEALPDHFTDDDRLDMEYRYWSFLESHPAHAPLAPESRAEAMDALTWSYTDCLLPSSRPILPPFTPQECQELMGLLRSSEGSSKNASAVQTRLVARVLLRVVQWRQYYFRPNKPLPRDAIRGPRRVERRIPFHRTMLDFLISCLCLGIPYIFLDRSQPQRIDEESGIRRSAGPMLVIGACACLVAAVILSASVTFISLPGLDDVARLAGLLAILFSASSMVSTVIALFRYKVDIERTVVYVGGEGLMLLSRRSVIMSLPLVFLAWAIAAFITGITFYSFRGATLTTRITIKHPFEDYTHWAVVGTMGGLAGMLMVSILLARR
ncbi:hypothetical protein AcV5_001475 [Taiwanofungus camphoratus]|nr:hypothetical protein AcV5_001475 [Antrodia cinnamomea]